MGIRYIVDTDERFRVFDLVQIWKVGMGDGIGRKAVGGFSAANYAYVLPQSRYSSLSDIS